MANACDFKIIFKEIERFRSDYPIMGGLKKQDIQEINDLEDVQNLKKIKFEANENESLIFTTT